MDPCEIVFAGGILTGPISISIDQDTSPVLWTVRAQYSGEPPTKLPGPIYVEATDEDLCTAWQDTADQADTLLEPPV